MLFPCHSVAVRCREFILRITPELKSIDVRVKDFALSPEEEAKIGDGKAVPQISAVLFPKQFFPSAKQFWQHTGHGASSRRAEYCNKLYDEGLLRLKEESEQKIEMGNMGKFFKGPRRYRRTTSMDESNSVSTKAADPEVFDSAEYIEERFGRNLDLSFADNAKLAVRRRIAGSLTENVGLTEALKLKKDEARTRQVHGFSEDDVYLYPTGMNSIFTAHRLLRAAGGEKKSISYGYACLRVRVDLQD